MLNCIIITKMRTNVLMPVTQVVYKITHLTDSLDYFSFFDQFFCNKKVCDHVATTCIIHASTDTQKFLTFSLINFRVTNLYQ